LFPLRDINPTRIRPVVTWALILANVAVYFLLQPPAGEAGSDDLPGVRFESRADEFAFRNAAIACELTTRSPLDASEILDGECVDSPTLAPVVFPDKNIWLSVGVSMFLHGSIAHILFNMWSLWIFGNNVEEAFGHVGYLLFYLAAGVAATLGFVLFNPELTIPLVGASGAIAGVMGAYLVLFPSHRILTIVIVFVTAVPAVVFLGFWFFSQFLIAGAQSGVAWEAHVAGFLVGVVVALPLRGRLLSNTLAGAQTRSSF
jgi:membrane associated rhomboid family serine protease